MGRCVKGWIVLVFLSFIFVGCGHKTPPIPPRSIMPRPVDVKEVRVRPNGVYLFFKLPTKYVKKGPINMGVFYKVERCEGTSCSVVATGRDDPGSNVVVRDARVKEGIFYHYVIRPQAEARGIPVDVPVKIGPFPDPPENLKGEAFQGRVELSWVGEPPFSLYRRVTVEEFSLTPLAVVQGLEYTDETVDNGVTYHYVVRAWRKKGLLVVESAPSQEVVATPMDTQPPPVPQGVAIHYRAGAVYIAWNPVSADDLAGYYLYRRSKGKEWRRVTKEAIPQPLYVDRDVVPGVTYEYRVSSVDHLGNISRPSRPVKIKIPKEGR